MASLVKKSGQFYVQFRWPPGRQGNQYTRNCKTDKKRPADAVRHLVENTIDRLTRRGDEIPDHVDAGDYILSGGKVKEIADGTTLEAAGRAYIEDRTDKAPLTLKGEKKHLRHLCRVLKDKTRIDRVGLDELKKYVKKRRTEPNRAGGKVSDATIRKELVTYKQLWEWAFEEGKVVGQCPLMKKNNPKKWAINLRKDSETEPFRTWAQIEKKIKREKLNPTEAKVCWAKLYLDDKQVAELLTYVSEHPRYSFMLLPFMLAARAGMRRREISVALCSDVVLEDNLIHIHEQKRDKGKEGTTRHCILSTTLNKELEVAIKEREARLVVNGEGKAFTEDMLTDQFRATVKNSKWDALKGWHTLRHSFASVCLSKDIPVHITAKWMGHTTQEMIELYQKTYIQDEQECAKLLD